MDDAEGFVAVGYFRHDDADSDEIIDAADVHIVALQFLIEAIEMLGAAADFGYLDLFFVQDATEQAYDAFHIGLPVAQVSFRDFLGFRVMFRIEILEAEVLELAFDFADAETVGDGRIDFDGFARDALLFFRSEVLERAHIVETVGELDDHDADILRHREEHLAQVFEIEFFLGTAQLDFAELGDAIDEQGDFRAEAFFDFRERDFGVFGDIVEDAGRERLRIHPYVREDLGDGEAVDDIVFAGLAFLSVVRLLRELVSSRDELLVIARKGMNSGGQDIAQGGGRWHRKRGVM